MICPNAKNEPVGVDYANGLILHPGDTEWHPMPGLDDDERLDSGNG